MYAQRKTFKLLNLKDMRLGYWDAKNLEKSHANPTPKL